jgi:hypothetical protein
MVNPTYVAKITINEVEYTITWDTNDKITIDQDLIEVLTGDELTRLLRNKRASKAWMDTASKTKLELTRYETEI